MSHSESAESAVRHAFQQAQKAQALDHVSKTLLHDLRNSLGGISGAAELVDLDAHTPQGTKDLLQIILSSTDSALEIINTLAAFIHDRDSNLRSFDLHTFLEQERKFTAACLGTVATLQFNYNANNPSIHCDELLLARALMNLILNAKESLNQHGRLCVSTANIHIGSDQRFLNKSVQSGTYLDLCVEDTGNGIIPDALPKVFEAGYSSRDHHAGMGLVSVNDFMRQLAGYVCIESTSKVGTKVHLLFPQK